MTQTKKAAYNKQYYKDNREKRATYYKRYRKDNREKNAQYRKDSRTSWIAWLPSKYKVCQKCGYDACFAALDFHHFDLTKKKGDVTGMFRLKFNKRNQIKFLAELEKCICFCATCHRELHLGNDLEAENICLDAGTAQLKIRLSHKPKIKTTQVQLTLNLNMEENDYE